MNRCLGLAAILVVAFVVLSGRAGSFDGAQWIGENPQPVYGAMTNAYAKLGPGPRLPKNAIRLRKIFRLAAGRIRSAMAHVTGLGAYELHVNGTNAQPNRILAPSWSNPDFRVLYDVLDIRNLLTAGADNAVGIYLAPGYSDDFANYGWRWLKSKRTIFRLDVDYADGRTACVVSDASWEWTNDQPIVWTSLYHGERFVADREDPDWAHPSGSRATWRPVAVLEGPTGTLQVDEGPVVEIGPPIHPVKSWKTPSGRQIFDFGGNSSYVPELMGKWPRGKKITLQFTEEIKDGDLDFRSHRGLIQKDEFTAAGHAEGETYRPRFTYHGFRYVGVSCDEPVQLVVREVTTRLRETATFASSDPMLNWLWDAARRSMRANFVSYPSDCNMRTERTPCLMDSNAYEDTAFQIYDIADYYGRWLFDSVRYQYGFGNGEKGGNTWNPDWQGESILLAERLLTYCAATNLALREYAGLARIADRFIEKSPKGIWQGGGFGDWLAKNDGNPFSCQQTVNTLLLHACCRAMARLAELKGETADAQRYVRHAQLVAAQFVERFVNRETGRIGEGRTTEATLAIALGLVPDEVRDKVLNALEACIRGEDAGHFATGIYGTRWIGDVLLDSGRGDLWLEMMRESTYPGFGFMRAQGATSLWEDWKPYGGALGMQSHNHAMRAGAVSCFLTHLGGIRPAADGYAAVRIRPCCPKSLGWVSVTRDLPGGRVSVAWWRTGDRVLIGIDAPPDLPLQVELPPDGERRPFEDVAARCAREIQCE